MCWNHKRLRNHKIWSCLNIFFFWILFSLFVFLQINYYKLLLEIRVKFLHIFNELSCNYFSIDKNRNYEIKSSLFIFVFLNSDSFTAILYWIRESLNLNIQLVWCNNNSNFNFWNCPCSCMLIRILNYYVTFPSKTTFHVTTWI